MHRRCDICPFAVGGKPNKFIEHRIPPIIDYVFIIETARHGEEDYFDFIKNKDFKAICQNNDININNVAVFSAVPCYPPEIVKPSLYKKAAKCCRGYMAEKLMSLPLNTPIMIFGKLSLLAITGYEDYFAKAGFIDRKINTHTAMNTWLKSKEYQE